jgi:hypothetical protein
MVKVAENVVYEAFGFTIMSEIDLPELTRGGNNLESNVIEIKVEDVSKLWLQLPKVHNKFVITENLIMFQIENIAIFLIQDGRKIIVSPLSEYNEDVVRLYILGSCMGAILFQRRILPLHGSAVTIEGKAYAVIGNSGAGKSTLASAFIDRGYPLLTDDVIAVTLTKEDKPLVTPSYPHQKLWGESLDKFGLDKNSYRPIYQRESKFVVPVTNHFSTEPIPLAGIFELERSESENIEMESISKLQSLRTIYKHTFRNPLISDLGITDWHFNYSTKISNYTNMYQIRRPSNRFTAHELVTCILETIKKGQRL